MEGRDFKGQLLWFVETLDSMYYREKGLLGSLAAVAYGGLGLLGAVYMGKGLITPDFFLPN
jgi:hypothetical protein